MFILLGECIYRKNYRQAANTYVECYPNREKKSHVAFKRLLKHFYCLWYYTKKEHEEKQLLMMKTQ